MTQISIDPTVARSVAQAIQRAGDQLDSARSGLSHQWASLDANWEGASKAPVEGSVRSALGDLTQAGERTYDLGVKLEAIAQRFEAADEAEGTPLMQILWGFLLGGALAGAKAGAQTLPQEYDKLEKEIQKRIKELEDLKDHRFVPNNSKNYDALKAAPEIMEKRDTIEKLAKRYNIDPALLAGVLASERDFDYSDNDKWQDSEGQAGRDHGGGLGIASVYPKTLNQAIEYLNHPPGPENSPPLLGASDAKAFDRSSQHRTTFEGSAEEAAIVLAMLNHAKGGDHSAKDMAVIWGAYRAGIKDFSVSGEGFSSLQHFKDNQANVPEGTAEKFQIGKNAYMSTPYFEFFKEKFAS